MTESGSLFRFRFFETDSENATLSHSGIRIQIQEQSFRMLMLLPERPGEVVTREELLQRLWPQGTYVDFDGSLKLILQKPSKFNTSLNELVRLNAAGVSDKELNAMLAASGKKPAGSAAPSPGGTSGENAIAMPPSKSRMPRLMVAQGCSTQELKLEKTQTADTKTKPSSTKNLAADSAVTQAMQTGVKHINSPIGGQTVQEAGIIVSCQRTPTVTYVWGVPSPASGNILQTTKPSFTVDLSRAMGVNPDAYRSAIVKLTPAQNTCRIVRATQGKEDVRSTQPRIGRCIRTSSKSAPLHLRKDLLRAV
jgi:hypothetical protein